MNKGSGFSVPKSGGGPEPERRRRITMIGGVEMIKGMR